MPSIRPVGMQVSTAHSNADVFRDSVKNDVLISTTTETQRILIGPRGGAASTDETITGRAVLLVDLHEVAVRGDMMVVGTLSAENGVSVGRLPVDGSHEPPLPPNPSSGLAAIDSIVTASLQDGLITPSKLAIGAVTAAALGYLAVTTASIADAAVTAAQLAGGSVTAAAIAVGAVGASALADGEITADKIEPALLASLRVVKDGYVTSFNIADSNVTYGKIDPAAIVQILTSNAHIVTADLVVTGPVTFRDVLHVSGDSVVAGSFDVVGPSRMAGLLVTRGGIPADTSFGDDALLARVAALEARMLALEQRSAGS